MIRTAFAKHMAPVVMAARPCAGIGVGYQWRNRLVAVHELKSVDNTTKRTTRRLEMATT
jgi:hypothetical protein